MPTAAGMASTHSNVFWTTYLAVEKCCLRLNINIKNWIRWTSSTNTRDKEFVTVYGSIYSHTLIFCWLGNTILHVCVCPHTENKTQCSKNIQAFWKGSTQRILMWHLFTDSCLILCVWVCVCVDTSHLISSLLENPDTKRKGPSLSFAQIPCLVYLKHTCTNTVTYYFAFKVK